ncbi:MAG TPA: hypothetical protein DCL09_06400 [Sutterella sp.]|nr:hypothetical protein [Sutterella sp.]
MDWAARQFERVGLRITRQEKDAGLYKSRETVLAAEGPAGAIHAV